MTEINPENAILAQLEFGIGAIKPQLAEIESMVNKTAMTAQEAFAKVQFNAPVMDTQQLTAQQAMVQQITTQGEAQRAAILSQGEAKTQAILNESEVKQINLVEKGIQQRANAQERFYASMERSGNKWAADEESRVEMRALRVQEVEEAAQIRNEKIYQNGATQRMLWEKKADNFILNQRELTDAKIAKLDAQTQAAMARTAAYGESTGGIGDLIIRHASWFATGAALFETFDLLKEGLVDVETGMKGLQTVLPELAHDQEAYNAASRETIDLMQKLGSDLDETMSSARSFGRMYKDVETVMGLTNNAILLNVIDQVELENAVKGNEAALSTYGDTLKSTNEVLAFSGKLMDSITNLSHNTLATGTDLVSILQQTSSAAKQANTSLDQLLGTGSAAIRATGLQGQGGNIGRMLRTVFTQLSAPSKDVEESISNIGVKMRDTNGELRSAYDIILDLSLATKDAKLSQEELNDAILKASSGKFQYNKLSALVGSFREIVKNTALSINSQGRTLEMAGQQLDTISRKAGQLKATLIDAFSGVGDNGLRKTIKDMIDGLNQFIMGLQNVNPAVYQFGAYLLEAIVIGKTFMAVYGLLMPLLTSIGTAMETFGIVTKVAATATKEAAVAQEALNLSMAKNPVGLLVTALSALAGVALYQYISKLGEAEMAQTKFNQAQEDEVTIASQKASQANTTINYLDTLKEKHKDLSDAIDSGKLSTGELEAAQKNLNAVDEAILILADEKTREQIKANGVTKEEIDLVIQSQVASKEAALSKITDQKKLTDETIDRTLDRIKALEKENALWLQMSASTPVNSNSFLNVGGGNTGGGFLGAIEAENNKLKAEEKKRADLVQSIITATGEIEGLRHNGGNTGGSGKTPKEAYSEPFKEYIQEVERSLPAVNNVIDEHKRKLDSIGIEQTLLKNQIGQTIPTLAQEVLSYQQLDEQLRQHKEIQTDLHATADQYREAMDGLGAAIATEDAKLAAGTISEKDHRQSVETLRDEYNKLQSAVLGMGADWMKEQESISNLNTSVQSRTESTREYRDSMIKSYKAEIDYLTRDGASQKELSQAYEKQGSYITLLMQKRADLNTQVVDGEKKLSDLQKAQESLNTSTEQGGLQYDFYGQAIAEVSGKLSDLKSEQIAANKAIEEANDLIVKNKLSELDKLYGAHMMTLDQYVESLQDVEDQYGSIMSAEEQFALNLEQSGSILDQWTRDINAALDDAENAFDEAMDAIDDSITAAQDSLDDFKDAVNAVFDAVDSNDSTSLLSAEQLQNLNSLLPGMMNLTQSIGLSGDESDFLNAIDDYMNQTANSTTSGLATVLSGVGTTMDTILSGAVSAATENATKTKAVDYYTGIMSNSDAMDVFSGKSSATFEGIGDLLKKKTEGTISDTELTQLETMISKSKTLKTIYESLESSSTTEYTTSKADFLKQLEDSVSALADADAQIDTALANVSAWQESEDTRIDNAIADKQQSLADNVALITGLFDELSDTEAKYARETAKNDFASSYQKAIDAANGVTTTYTGTTPTVTDLTSLYANLPSEFDTSLSTYATSSNLALLTQDEIDALTKQVADAATQGLDTLEAAKLQAETYISDLADSTESQIADIEKQLADLEEEETSNTRTDAEEEHIKKLKELNEQLAYESVRTGQDHLENIEDINQQIADENESWSDTQRDWTLDDKKTELQTQKETLQAKADLLNQALSDFVTYINSEISTREQATEDYKASLEEESAAEIEALETEKSIVDQRATLLTEMLTAEQDYIKDEITQWQKLADDRVDISTAETNAIIANYTAQKDAATETWEANKSAIQSVMQDSTMAQLAMMAAINGKGSSVVEDIIDLISDSSYKQDITSAIDKIVDLATPTVTTPTNNTSDEEEDEESSSGSGTGSGTTTPTTPTRTPWKAYYKAEGVYQDPATGKWMAASYMFPSNVFALSKSNAFHYLNPDDGVDYYSIGDIFRNSGLGYTVDPPDASGWINAYAKGTDYYPGGWGIAGEEGPELIKLPVGSQIIPNKPTMGLLKSDFMSSDEIQPMMNEAVMYALTEQEKVYPDLSNITALIAEMDRLQVQINVNAAKQKESDFDKLAIKIVAALKEGGAGTTIGNAVNIEHYEAQDNTDIEILGRDVGREIMRQVGQK